MKISLTASENNLPFWMKEENLQSSKTELPTNSSESLSDEEIERISKMAESLSEDALVEECEHIEICASSGNPYYCSASWSESHLSGLKEYASVCGLKDFVTVDAKEIQASVQSRQMTKAASSLMTETMTREADTSEKVIAQSENPLDAITLDPFHLDESSREATGGENWQKIGKQSNLGEDPDSLSHSVRSIRGGEDYQKSSHIAFADNQNSIADPEAIERLANSEDEDTGVRLKREIEERKELRAEKHQEWQQDYLDGFGNLDIVPKGKVFPTETMNAQPGLNTPSSSSMGVYANFDPDSIPELTPGESLASAQEARRKAIQGEDRETHQFEAEKNPMRGISDDFGDSLAELLEK